MGRDRSRRDRSRDEGPFLAITHAVIRSDAYRNLSHPARSLLIDIAQQYNSYNNGKLTACAKYLRPLGWTSNAVVTRAKKELLESGLLIETRKGARPNKAAWYMVSWYENQVLQGMDAEPIFFAKKRQEWKRQMSFGRAGDGTSLTPAGGVGAGRIAPSHGVRR